MRTIPCNISKKLENEDKLGQDILDFVTDDLKNNGDENPEIKDIDLEILSNLSKFPGFMKQIIKNPNLWDIIKKEYGDPNITNKNRGNISNLLKNALKSNYNVESLINDDPQGIKMILDKIINNPMKSLDDEDNRKIAENEVEALCNLLKDDNNYKSLIKGDILTHDLNKLENLYKDLEPEIIEPLLSLLARIKEADKAKKEKDIIEEDEDKIREIEKRVGQCFESHRKALIDFAKISNDNKPIDSSKEEAYSQYLNNLASLENQPNEENPLEKKLSEDELKEKPLLRKKSSLRNNELLKNTSSLLKKKLSFVSGTLLFNQDNNAKIKSSLSTMENPEMSEDLGQILTLLRKNYNDMKNSDDIDMNIKRMDNIQKCLSLLKKLSLAPDNHKPILEGGFINFMEKLDKDYKLFNEDGTPNANNKNLGFEVSGKNTLQACSNSDNAIPIISESPIFDSIIDEVLKLYEEPGLIASNSDVQKIFLYDNVIFSNLCKNKEAFNKIFNKIGLDKLLNLGRKTGNVNLLDACLNMLKNYIKNTPNKEDIPPEIFDTSFQILDKCINLKDRNAPLMSKVLDIASNLYSTDSLKPRIENLKLLKSISNDIPKFKNDHQYLNSALNCLSMMAKDNPGNGQEAINSGLFQILNNEVSKVLKDGPEKYSQNKDNPNQEEDPNGYLKTCFNLAKLYNSLLKNDLDSIDKYNKLGVTENTVKMLDTFNDKMKPLTEEEKEEENAKKCQLLRTLNNRGELSKNKLGKKDEKKPPIQCIKIDGKELEKLADPEEKLPKQYKAADLFEPVDEGNKLNDFNPEYYYIKLLQKEKYKPSQGLEKIDTGDDNILVIKISKDKLDKYEKAENGPDEPSKVRQLFKEAEEISDGVECYYRKVLAGELDKPETAKLEKIPLNTNVDDLYTLIKENEGEFKSPEEGIQLVKAIGYIDPKELNKHITQVKQLYNKKDAEGLSSGTTVQCVKINRPNKEGVKELMQYIKALRGNAKKGEEPLSFYRVPKNADLRQILEDIQTTGLPKGKEGVDYEKLAGDELEDVKKLFKGTENDPKTYYYTSAVKGDGAPYGNGKINSVTILSDPNNKLNKDSQVKQVFRKVEEANEKKDNDAYYYTKAIGDKIKRGLEPIKTTRETDIKDIYNKVKGDMSNKSEDDEYIFIIKVKGDKSVNDALNKIKASGAMISKADKEEEIDYNLNKIKGNTKMKEIYNNVKRPNGAVLIKAAEGTDYDDVLNQVKSSQLLESKPDDEEKEKEEDLLHQKIQDDSSTKKSTLKGAQKLEKVEGDKPIQYMLVTNDILSKYDKTNKIADLFKNEKKKIEPKGKPLYLYRKISRPPAEGDSQLNNIKENENLDDLYQKLKNSKIITDKPGEGIQIFKVIGPADSNDYMKHINESEALYKKPGDDDGQIRIQSVKLYPHGKDSDENNAIVYIKVMGGFKPDIFYKSQGETDLNSILQQIQEKGVPEKDGKPLEVVSGEELEKVKKYFKPKDDDLNKLKSKEDEIKTPKAYFYTSKVINKQHEDSPIIIQSVTILSDPNNNLNNGLNIESLFADTIGLNKNTTYYFAPYNLDKKDEEVQLQQVKETHKINELKLKNAGDCLQVIKVLGDTSSKDIAKHVLEARDISKIPGEDGKIPLKFYYKTKVLGEEEKSDESKESVRKGKVDSVTIKRDPDNRLHKEKDVETVFKEGEEEEDSGNDLGEPVYYYVKIKGGINNNPEELKLVKIDGKEKIDDIYNEIKKLGPLEINDGIQLYKVSGDVDNDSLLAHVKDAGELFNNAEEDKKSQDATTSYYTTEVFGENEQKKKSQKKDGDLIQSLTMLPEQILRNKNKNISQLFRDEDGSKDLETPEETEILYYYTKIIGGSADKPEIQLVKIGNDAKMGDLIKPKIKGTIFIKASENASTPEILDLIKKSGLLATLYNSMEEESKVVKEPMKEEPNITEIKKAIQYAKVSPIQLKNISDPDLEQKYNVEDMFGPLDEEEGVEEDPNPKYYYTKILNANKVNPDEDPLLAIVDGKIEMAQVNNYVNGKEGKDENGALIIKAPHNTKQKELINQIKEDALNIYKPEDGEDEEITTAIYYTTEEIRKKPKGISKLFDGNIPLKLYLLAKSKEGGEEDNKNVDTSSSSGEYNLAPQDNETADNKKPNEMVRDIMKYSIDTLDQITVAPDSNEFLAKKTTFMDTITKTLQNENNDVDSLLTGLHSLGNYLFNENGPNYSKLDLEKTYQLLHDLQSKYYAKPEILNQVNYIASSLIKNLKNDSKGKEYTKKFYELVPESTKCQDNNPDLVLLSMKIMHDGLEKKSYLIDEVYDETVPVVLSLLKLYKDNPDIQENGYSILSLFGNNKVFATSMINHGILPEIKEILQNILFNDSLKEKNKSITSQLFKLLSNIAQDNENCPKIADEVMGQLIQNLNDKGYTEENNGKDIVKLLDTLLNNNQCVAPFVQYGGIDTCISLFANNDSNVELVSSLFQIFKKVANENDEYKKILQDKKMPELINRIIKKVGVYDKNLEFEGRQLLFTINLCKIELENPNKINVEEIKIIEPIPPEVKNFLTNGKQVKIINEQGEVKQMQLIFSQDLMKVSAKKLKSTLPPKPKYIIDTITIKKILKGHGTDAFKKSKGLFRNIPNPEVCFSIIGPTTVDGVQALNIECETEAEADKWIDYLKIVINYFKKTKAIKGNVVIKK